MERVSSIRSTLRVIRIIAIIESSSKFGIAEDFIGFIDDGHFLFAASFIGVCVLGGLSAVRKRRES